VLFRYEFNEQRRGIFKVKEFEEAFAKYCGSSYGQAVTSGTAALKVALKALGVGPGDEVITQGFTFVATWEAILDVGATPVFAEIDETLNMDPQDAEKKITDKTKCIIPVHMLGAPARIEEIVAMAKRRGIPVLEDTAQAAGGTVGGRHLGTFGQCGTFSFDAVKTMTTGEGGMVITDDVEIWRTLSEYQDHGHDHSVNPGGRGGEGRRFIGFNYRMMEIQGAIGLAQLAKLDTMIARQRETKALFQEAVSSIPGVTPREMVDEKGDTATFFSFLCRDSNQCQRINAHLRSQGVGGINFSENTWHFYTRWEHLFKGATLAPTDWPLVSFDKRQKVIYDPAALPQSSAIMERTLVFPISLKMQEKQVSTFCSALKSSASL
ncbi:unnamed protein product, partial [Cyprideis torosa]